MSERRLHFLVLDSGEGEATLTIAHVDVKGGRLKTAARTIRGAIEARGMWCTPIHPRVAEILTEKCKGVVDGIAAHAGLKGPFEVARLIQEKP